MKEKLPITYFDSNEIVWEAPPRSRKEIAQEREDRWARIYKTLRDHPNEWAVIAVKPGPSANVEPFKFKFGPEFDVTTRRMGSETRIYARYIGAMGDA
jgi:hypothetical protein